MSERIQARLYRLLNALHRRDPIDGPPLTPRKQLRPLQTKETRTEAAVCVVRRQSATGGPVDAFRSLLVLQAAAGSPPALRYTIPTIGPKRQSDIPLSGYPSG